MTVEIESGLRVLLAPTALRAALERDATAGLTAQPKWLPPKYFYDDRGSELFDEITRLEEYYPTRAERSILQTYAGEIVTMADCRVLLELGSGSSEKTRVLLDAMAYADLLDGYVPVDVSAGALREAISGLERDYPKMAIHGAVADFDAHLDDLPRPGRRLWALLGGTIGNYPPAERRVLLDNISAAMATGEAFLLGIDLVKDPARLVRAYDDARGVTAEFNRNVIRVLDRELDGDLDPAAFDHVALWDAENEWIEMRLRAQRRIVGRLAGVNLEVTFEAGEEVRTEISAKFRRERIEAEVRTAGLTPVGWWSDGDFALILATKEEL